MGTLRTLKSVLCLSVLWLSLQLLQVETCLPHFSLYWPSPAVPWPPTLPLPGFHLNPCLLLLIFALRRVLTHSTRALFNHSTIHTQLALEVNSTSGTLLSFSEVSMGEHNSRARIAELIHRLLGKTVCLQAWIVWNVLKLLSGKQPGLFLLILIHWIAIYPVDSVLQPSNNKRFV